MDGLWRALFGCSHVVHILGSVEDDGDSIDIK